MQYSFNRREPIFQYERDASRHTRAHVHAHTHHTLSTGNRERAVGRRNVRQYRVARVHTRRNRTLYQQRRLSLTRNQ